MIVQRMRRADPGALEQVVCGCCGRPFASDEPTTFSRTFGRLGADAWVHEVCPSDEEPVRDYVEVITWTRHDLPVPIRQTSPLASPEMQVALALIRSAERSLSPGEVAMTAWELIGRRVTSRMSAAERHGLSTSAQELLSEPGDPADRLLGYWKERRRGADTWYRGIAGLEPRPAEAMRLAMAGWMPWEIQKHLKPKRDGEMPALESVYAWLSEGRRALRELFHMPAREET